MGLAPFVPPMILGAVAFYLGIRGYISTFLYYVPVSLAIIAALLWAVFGLMPIHNPVIMALLAMGLFLCACFGTGLLLNRMMRPNS